MKKMNKKIFIPFVIAIVTIVGFLGYQSVSAITSTYTQPLYDAHDTVAPADQVTNAYSRDVIGNKTDAAAAGAVSATESIMAYVKQIAGGGVNTGEKLVTNTAKALPATSQSPIFTITGGPIEVLSLVGIVTTDIQAQACNLDIIADPTTPGTDTTIAAALEINDDENDTMYSCVTALGTALAEYTNGVGVTMGGVFSFTMPVGAIDIGTTATNTGNITWMLRYKPLVSGVTVTAN